MRMGGLMDLHRNQPFMTALCFLTVPLAIGIGYRFPDYLSLSSFMIFVASGLGRFVRDRVVKILVYLFLGFAAYWVACQFLYTPLGDELLLLSTIPFLFLGFANATAALVSYNDGRINGLFFASGGLAAFFMTKGPLDTGGIDRFLVTGLLMLASSIIFVLFSSWNRGAKDAPYSALKASIISSVIYGFVLILRIYDINMLNFANPQMTIRRVSPVFFHVGWLSFISDFFFMTFVLLLYEALLYATNLQRIVRPESVQLVRMEERIEEEDPFAPLVEKLQKFFENYSRYSIEEASSILSELDKEYYHLAGEYDTPMKSNASKMLMEARSLLLGTRVEFKAPTKARRRLLTIPKRASVIVEGPIGSMKEEFCLDLLKRELKRGRVCMIISYDPQKEIEYVNPSDEEKKGLLAVKVEQNINEMALAISRALEKKPDFVFFNVLYWLVPNHPINTIVEFLNSTLKKLARAKATSVFVMEKEMLSQRDLSTIESLFSGVIEFKTVEEKGVIKSKYRIKEFKLKKFGKEWNYYG